MAAWTISPAARRDIERIALYYSREFEPDTADDMLHRILEHIEIIAAHPHAFPAQADGSRMSVIPRLRHRVVYVYEEGVARVEVMEVVHARRPWREI
jgi:plasmid stabilization system protein ParE